jgi:hypothetical protein
MTDFAGAPPAGPLGDAAPGPPAGVRIEGDAATGVRARPAWERAPAGVRAMVTLRAGGVSRGPWGLADGSPGGWNLARHVGDDEADVAENRRRLRALLPAEPLWLDQVHGTGVLVADGGAWATEPADAAVTSVPGVVLAVMTADCLPVLFATRDGRAVGVAHAGWRGMAAGVLERTLEALLACDGRDANPSDVVAWLGPAIGPQAFEVGPEVLEAFVAADARAASCFAPGAAAGKWFADLFGLARLRLAASGVGHVEAGGWCTVQDRSRLFSYRRDRVTGRMATLIWRDGG